MDVIRRWAVGLCFAALGGTILRRMAPEKGTGTVFRVLLSAFFILLFFTPFLTPFSLSQWSFSEWGLPELSTSLLEETVERRLAESVKSAASDVVNTTLSAQGITAQKIEVTTDTTQDGSIYIERIDVWLSSRYSGKKARAREILEKRLETTVSIKEVGE